MPGARRPPGKAPPWARTLVDRPTSTVTAPLLVALGLGLASNVPDSSLLLDGFGLIAFASLFPMMSVLAYAMIQKRFFSRVPDSRAKPNP
ncbi:MAG: DUF1538 family protein [Nitrospinae bacterium]|nr:DUF1538 family protein [Nitrospinota bacterium]